VSSHSLSAEYIKEKQWGDWEQQAWQDMTAKPGILISEMVQDFQVKLKNIRGIILNNNNQGVQIPLLSNMPQLRPNQVVPLSAPPAVTNYQHNAVPGPYNTQAATPAAHYNSPPTQYTTTAQPTFAAPSVNAYPYNLPMVQQHAVAPSLSSFPPPVNSYQNNPPSIAHNSQVTPYQPMQQLVNVQLPLTSVPGSSMVIDVNGRQV